MSFDAASFQPTHFLWHFAEGVATVTLNRPERKNPLTFESYAELRDIFRELVKAPQVKVVVMCKQSDPLLVRGMKAAGASAVLTRWADWDELVREIRQTA